ncbi:MAG: dipeptide epimerase [Pseudomonadota bacterium]
MNLTFETRFLKKRFPLKISRGTHSGRDNLFIAFSQGDVTGWGEMSPGKTEGADTTDSAAASIQLLFDTNLEGLSVQQIYDRGMEMDIPACALAGIDIALWDWLGKKQQTPLYIMFGLSKPKVPSSVTIGINPPEIVRERVPLLMEGTGVRSLKIKLGSPDGEEADRAMFNQVVESTRSYDVKLRVDANGGWDLNTAKRMMKWLAENGVDYIEQPLKEGEEDQLPELFKNRALPIYVDESCRFASDIPKFAHAVDGVNMKLMKCGGLTGALRITATARAFGLKTMIGCMGESSMSISAAAAITGMLDHIDLDSHLNLDPDPCTGASFVDGVVVPNDLPGHGAQLKNDI